MSELKQFWNTNTLQSSVSRDELFAGLCLLGCINGLWTRIIHSVQRYGLIDAVLSTFDTSVVVWVTCFLGISMILQDRAGKVSRIDLAVGTIVFGLIALPIGALSWVALTGLCIYILSVTPRTSARRRGAIILLATTVPMLWSLMVYQFFANIVLEIDASLIGWLLGTERTGNIVRFLHGPDYLVVLPSCSSLANTSLAFLCWVAMGQVVHHRWRPEDLLWCGLACVTVVTLNVLRMSLMAMSYGYYQAIHSPIGTTTSNLVITMISVGVCIAGLRRELFHA
jgi:hypothetical protein